MKRILIPAVALFAACTSPEAQPEAQISYDYFGDTVQVADTTSLTALLAQLQGGTDSVYGTFAAPISSVCQVKGCWMQLDLGNGEEALVRFKDYGFFVPMDAASELAFVEGGLKVDTSVGGLVASPSGGRGSLGFCHCSNHRTQNQLFGARFRRCTGTEGTRGSLRRGGRARP